jgi:hypothetical protein
MRRVLSLVSAGVLAMFASAVQAQAQTTNFTATLHGGNEVPGVSTGAAGTASSTDLVPRTAQGIGSWDDFVQALSLGNIYVNVHRTNNPGGELRGQVIRQ